MDDLIAKNKSYLAKVAAQRMDRLVQEDKRRSQKAKPAKFVEYRDGQHYAQTPGNRPLPVTSTTNGALAKGQTVRKKGDLIDAMPRVRTDPAPSTPGVKPKYLIKYAWSLKDYQSGITEVYAGGWQKQPVLVKTLPNNWTIQTCIIDNLGSDGFILNLQYKAPTATSYTLEKIRYNPTTKECETEWIRQEPKLSTGYGHGFWVTRTNAELPTQTQTSSNSPDRRVLRLNGSPVGDGDGDGNDDNAVLVGLYRSGSSSRETLNPFEPYKVLHNDEYKLIDAGFIKNISTSAFSSGWSVTEYSYGDGVRFYVNGGWAQAATAEYGTSESTETTITQTVAIAGWFAKSVQTITETKKTYSTTSKTWRLPQIYTEENTTETTRDKTESKEPAYTLYRVSPSAKQSVGIVKRNDIQGAPVRGYFVSFHPILGVTNNSFRIDYKQGETLVDFTRVDRMANFGATTGFYCVDVFDDDKFSYFADLNNLVKNKDEKAVTKSVFRKYVLPFADTALAQEPDDKTANFEVLVREAKAPTTDETYVYNNAVREVKSRVFAISKADLKVTDDIPLTYRTGNFVLYNASFHPR